MESLFNHQVNLPPRIQTSQSVKTSLNRTWISTIPSKKKVASSVIWQLIVGVLHNHKAYGIAHTLTLRERERVKSKAYGLAHILTLQKRGRAKSKAYGLVHISTLLKREGESKAYGLVHISTIRISKRAKSEAHGQSHTSTIQKEERGKIQSA